jgi:hypothetical protein
MAMTSRVIPVPLMEGPHQFYTPRSFAILILTATSEMAVFLSIPSYRSPLNRQEAQISLTVAMQYALENRMKVVGVLDDPTGFGV